MSSVLLYTLSTLSLAVNAALSLSLSTLVLVGQPMESEQMIGSESAFIPYDLSPLNNAFYAASVLSFILTWTAIVLILRQHFRKLGRVKYWVMVSIPLVYFLTQFQTFFVFLLFSLGFAASISFVIIYTIIFSASKPIGGILFATAFWAMASSINNDQLKAYMIISAFGLALRLRSSKYINEQTISAVWFSDSIFFGLASYLFFVGIYSSVVSLSQDSKLRGLIRSSLARTSNLLDVMARAHLEKEIVTNISSIVRKQSDEMNMETGITSSLDDSEIARYIDEVISEFHKSRTNIKDH